MYVTIIVKFGGNMKIYKIVILFIFACLGSYFIYDFIAVKKGMEYIDLSKAKKLMIVAHPDDETFWGGAHLIDDDYLVVCITCGGNRKRVKEFKKVMKNTNDQYMMLGYPDVILGVRSDWSKQENEIYNDLEKVMLSKKWKLIVTHNEEGEYGHIHHKKINKIVTEIYETNKLKNDFYYFGTYYTKRNLINYEKYLNELPNEKYELKKKKMIDIYDSQEKARKMFDHMFPYEMWKKYEKSIA